MARLRPEINAGSMADIAFLLLIFFLVTATMDVDSGMMRKLPPLPAGETEKVQIEKRNIFEVLINSHDQLLVNGRPGDINILRKEAVAFISNRSYDAALPDKELLSVKKAREAAKGNYTEVTEIQNAVAVMGDYPVSQGVISLQNDRGTSYNMYLNVQNELAAAYRELRDELSRERFGVNYAKLRDPLQIKAVERAIPMNISEAEPKNTGGAK